MDERDIIIDTDDTQTWHDLIDESKLHDVVIWRYMDLSKFISVLQSKSLWFTRSDMFLDDPFEGTYTIKTKRDILNSLGEANRGLIEEKVNFHQENERKEAFISCWYEDKVENSGMWKLYLKSDEGIVIKTNYQNLKGSIHPRFINQLTIGRVKYLDPFKENPADEFSNYTFRFLWKRHVFKNEREIRAVLFRPPTYLYKSLPEETFGLQVNVDLNLLIQEIYVAPKSPSWFKTVVEGLLNVHEMGHIKVFNSELDQKPD